MKPRPRLRRAVARWGAVVSVVLLVVWGASAFHWVSWGSRGGLVITIARGAAGFYEYADWSGVKHPMGFRINSGTPKLLWWFHWNFDLTLWFLSIPLWLPFTLALAATITARRLDAKARRLSSAPACPRCAYPRAGLIAGTVCPECGSPAPTP